MTRPRRVVARAHAKINLDLRVLGTRADGFHELRTVFQTIELHDTLVCAERPGPFALKCRTPGVPLDDSNLVWRAAAALWRALGRAGDPQDTVVTIEKVIPMEAGLGGGSADAAAALLAMEKLSGLRTSRARRAALAAALGSDVPFAVLGGTCLGTGRGERLQRLRLARPFRALVVVPPWRISTANAFHQIDRKRLALTDWSAKLRFARLLSRAPVVPGRALRLGNRFEDVLGERQEEFLSLRDRLQAAGAIDVGLSGSGSAIFGTIPPELPSKIVARRFAGNEPHFAVRSERSSMRLEIP